VPSVKISRDRRGNQTFALVHAPSAQGRGAAPAKTLYWFRTPSGLRIGREPFDLETRRQLEARYPTISFDWERLAETPAPPPEEPWRERRRIERAAKVRAAELAAELAAERGQGAEAGASAERAVAAPTEDSAYAAAEDREEPAGAEKVEAASEKERRDGLQSRRRRHRGRRRTRDSVQTVLAKSPSGGESSAAADLSNSVDGPAQDRDSD